MLTLLTKTMARHTQLQVLVKARKFSPTTKSSEMFVAAITECLASWQSKWLSDPFR